MNVKINRPSIKDEKFVAGINSKVNIFFEEGLSQVELFIFSIVDGWGLIKQ
jgi:formiminotetrahydrofolate cyclodeaminase